jgi:hypothetical protein
MVALTVDEWCAWLSPPVSRKLLTALIRELGVPQSGARRTGRAGHPAPTYDAEQIIALHAALYPWLATPGPAASTTHGD